MIEIALCFLAVATICNTILIQKNHKMIDRLIQFLRDDNSQAIYAQYVGGMVAEILGKTTFTQNSLLAFMNSKKFPIDLEATAPKARPKRSLSPEQKAKAAEAQRKRREREKEKAQQLPAAQKGH